VHRLVGSRWDASELDEAQKTTDDGGAGSGGNGGRGREKLCFPRRFPAASGRRWRRSKG